jgi:phenylalanyl-tRNA synthetase alpha chain
MLAKGLDHIRLLRSEDPRIAGQMRDLEPYRPVSRHPPIRRDLSVVVALDADAEALGDRVREALGPQAGDVEAIEVLSETRAEALPVAARDRLGIGPAQKNILLRLTLRALGRTLTDDEANRRRDDVYMAIHEGARSEWACGGPPAAR